MPVDLAHETHEKKGIKNEGMGLAADNRGWADSRPTASVAPAAERTEGLFHDSGDLLYLYA